MDLAQLSRALCGDGIDGGEEGILLIVGNHVLTGGKVHVDVDAVATALGLVDFLVYYL